MDIRGLRIIAVLGVGLSGVAVPAQAPAPVQVPPAPLPPQRALVPPAGTVLERPDVPRLECAAPGKPRGRSYYVDPAAGTDSGDGSPARPWRTLAEVMARPGAAAPRFAAGDTIVLLAGDHGDVTISGRNTGFVTVRAAPGAVPQLRSLSIKGASFWVFDGLKVSGLRNEYAALVLITPQGAAPVDNIVLTNTLVTSADDVSAWTQADWASKARFFGIRTDGGTDPKAAGCITIAHNHITHVYVGAAIATSNSRVTDNLIDNFSGDGLDVAGSHLVIARNLITDNIEANVGNHNDGIQMQAGRVRAYRDIIIDGNTIIRQTRADAPFPSYLQGISGFNSDWFDLTVTNNVVITNAPHGIAFGSVHGGLFANNIVLNDEAKAPNFGTTWIRISPRTHEGFEAGDVIVRNNIALDIVNATFSPSVRLESNISRSVSVPIAGKTQTLRQPGVIGGDNRNVANLKPLFVDYAPTRFRFDLRPANPGSAPNWPDRLMPITGGPAGGPQPGIAGADK